jgi:pyruvate formate lyase activating enzyme
MQIKGFQETSFIDYPGKICSLVFLGNCNFRCPYCHNPDLIRKAEALPTIAEQNVLDFIEKKSKWIDAVCITGGEPSLDRSIIDLMVKLKKKGFLVKFDTNGTNPEILKEMIKRKLVDFIAMDIKNPLKKYEEIIKAKTDIKKIKQSIEIIKKSGIDYEFRTTILPKHHTEKEVLDIAKDLKSAKKYVLQNFKPGKCLDETYNKEKTFSHDELMRFKELVKGYFKEVEVRE